MRFYISDERRGVIRRNSVDGAQAVARDQPRLLRRAARLHAGHRQLAAARLEAEMGHEVVVDIFLADTAQIELEIARCRARLSRSARCTCDRTPRPAVSSANPTTSAPARNRRHCDARAATIVSPPSKPATAAGVFGCGWRDHGGRLGHASGEHEREQHDGQQEVRDRTGRDNREPAPYRLAG